MRPFFVAKSGGIGHLCAAFWTHLSNCPKVPPFRGPGQMATAKKSSTKAPLPVDADVALSLALAVVTKRNDPTPKDAVDVCAKVWAAQTERLR
jgi:hypothetical protein